ncbi:MAG: hypothetical protein JNL70_05875 [Saprospiraceae bacterium]|nr:hypothetical protein [Saprospiraceae bacterium]
MAVFKDFYRNNQNLLNRRLLIFCLVVIPFLGRQSLYGVFVQYRVGQERVTDTQLDAPFERYILTHPDVYDRRFNDVNKIIHIALKVTADALSLKDDPSVKTAPLSTWRSGETNSEGFAAFFNTTCTYLIHRFRMDDQYQCHQFIAERMRGGMNLADAIQSPYDGKSPFNKTRDIVGIVDVKTRQARYVDPTIYEQAGIVDIQTTDGAYAPQTRSVERLKRRSIHRP